MLVEWRARAKRALRTRIDFLNRRNPRAAREAAATIIAASERLGEFPNIGRLAGGRLRELVVPFGSEGYVLLYTVGQDGVVIRNLKHQREASY